MAKAKNEPPKCERCSQPAANVNGRGEYTGQHLDIEECLRAMGHRIAALEGQHTSDLRSLRTTWNVTFQVEFVGATGHMHPHRYLNIAALRPGQAIELAQEKLLEDLPARETWRLVSADAWKVP